MPAIEGGGGELFSSRLPYDPLRGFVEAFLVQCEASQLLPHPPEEAEVCPIPNPANTAGDSPTYVQGNNFQGGCGMESI